MAKSKAIQSYDDKDDVVANLYALRAGLSAISQQADEIREREHLIDNEKKKIEAVQSEIYGNNKKISDKNAEIANVIKKISNIRGNYSNKVSDISSNKSSKFDFTDGARWFFIAGGIATFLSIFFTSILGFSGALVIFYIISGILIIAGIVLTVITHRARKTSSIEARAQVNGNITGYEKQIKEIQERISFIEKVNSELSIKKSEVSKEVAAKVEEINADIKNIAYGVAVYNDTLEKAFSKLLNPADWQNVDLCIFYLQTGRADTIKECLLLVDRQRQNDEIVGAIRAASDRICGEIRGGFAALGSTMVTCINALSGQIEVMCNTLNEQHEQKMRVLESVDAKSAEILTSAQLNNALLEKANASSEELLRDYKYVQSNYGIMI